MLVTDLPEGEYKVVISRPGYQTRDLILNIKGRIPVRLNTSLVSNSATMAVASDPRICERESVELGIITPTGLPPIRCTGRIIWHLESSALYKGCEKYLVRIFIADISRIDERRLDSLVARKQALANSGYTLS